MNYIYDYYSFIPHHILNYVKTYISMYFFQFLLLISLTQPTFVHKVRSEIELLGPDISKSIIKIENVYIY